MHRFYCPDALAPDQEVEIRDSDSHHLHRVLRLRPGANVALFDGKGTLAEATLVSVSSRTSRARVVAVTRVGARSHIVLAFGIPKAAALDFIVRRAIELGVSALAPLVTEHSSKAAGWNAERWERVAIEVAKQCEALYLPELFAPQTLASWLKSRDVTRQLVYCSERARGARPSLKGAGADLVIGPEGGWSETEIATFEAEGAALGLGPQRLRAETAALVALALVKELTGELSVAPGDAMIS